MKPLTSIFTRVLLLLSFALVVSAQADVTHRYSFNDGNANDSIGTANGTLMNGATVSGGKLVLANNGVNNNIATGQYVSLPSNILHTRDFTVESWFTWNGGNPWQRILDLGNSVSGNGLGFIILTMNGGRAPLGQISINSWGNPADTDYVYGNTAFPVGGEHDLAYVFNADASQEQLFLDGSLIASGPTHVDPSTANYSNFYIGRSQFLADPFYAGSIDELRTYNNALTGAQIANDWAAGPDVLLVPEPASTSIMILAICLSLRKLMTRGR
jgi:Concanavalin A-like lectin/glucanases superfamily